MHASFRALTRIGVDPGSRRQGGWSCVVCHQPLAGTPRLVSLVGVSKGGSVMWACTDGCLDASRR